MKIWVFDVKHGICFGNRNIDNPADRMLKLLMDLMNDLAHVEQIDDPKCDNAVSTLEQHNMQWCHSCIYAMRKMLTDKYLQSIENGTYYSHNNYIDIDEYCIELIKHVKRSEEYFQQQIDWKLLVEFIERHSCINKDDVSQDILFKHWWIKDLNTIDSVTFKQ
eukprot:145024_1